MSSSRKVQGGSWTRFAASCGASVRLLVPLAALVSCAGGEKGHEPIPAPVLDMHLHARDAPDGDAPARLCLPVTVYGVQEPECPDPLVAPSTDEAMVERTVEILERRNVFGVISGDSFDTLERFVDAAPERLMPAYELELTDAHLTAEELRAHFTAGRFVVLGEVAVQYDGASPDDPRLEPYWDLAEELDVPVALHLGEGYPGAPFLGSPNYRVRFGSPLLLEDVLVRHPDLRIYVMHFGSPLVEEMLAILATYPNVYIDVGGNTWPYPREFFYSQLRRFVEAGFGKRILFGSDQMRWPDLIEISIDVIEQAPFLSEDQKRDILYNNAARFLRLSQEQIARHHAAEEP